MIKEIQQKAFAFWYLKTLNKNVTDESNGNIPVRNHILLHG